MAVLHLRKPAFSILFCILFLAQAAAEPVYRIVADTYTITGRTRQSVLESILGNAVDREFPSRADVDRFAEERTKKLNNLRSFREASVSVTLGNEENGVISVMLETAITDGTAFVPIPYAFYNSNQGFMGGLLLNAPNVSGTLMNFTSMGLYSAPPDNDDKLQWTEPNFMILASMSNIRIDPVIVQVTGIAMRMHQKMENLGVLRNKFLTLSFTGMIAGEVPLTDTVSSKSSFRFTYFPDYEIDYITDDELLSWGPLESALAIKTGFVFSDFHWTGNLRSGCTAEIAAGIERTDPALAAIHSSFIAEGEVSAFYLVSQRFNPQARVTAFGRTGEPIINAGQKIRGVRNGELRGNAGVFINTGVQIFLVRIGSVEIHLTPCLDAAWLYTDDTDYRQNDYALAAGAELLFFLDALKSMPIKLGAGYDLRPEEKNGSGKFYEIDFSFALTY